MTSLTWWKAGRGDGIISEGGADAFTVRTLLRTAVSILEAAKSADGLKFVASLLADAPQLTPTVATYVRKVAALAPADATSTIHRGAEFCGGLLVGQSESSTRPDGMSARRTPRSATEPAGSKGALLGEAQVNR